MESSKEGKCWVACSCLSGGGKEIKLNSHVHTTLQFPLVENALRTNTGQECFFFFKSSSTSEAVSFRARLKTLAADGLCSL